MKHVLGKSFADTIKGIESYRQDMFRACAKFTTVYESGLGQMKVNLAKAEEEAKALRAIALKKKSKWLASAKYKDKIKGYLEVIDSVRQDHRQPEEAAGHDQDLRSSLGHEELPGASGWR